MSLESLHDFRIRLDDVLLLADVILQVVELRGFSFVRMEFPLPGPHRLQLVSAMVKERFVWCLGLADERRPDVFAIDDPIGWDRCTSQLRECRQQIHGGHEFVVGLAGRNLSRPADRRSARACRLRRCVPLLPRRGPALPRGVLRGAVVGGEEDERVFVETVGLEGVEDLPDGPVDFGDGLTEEFVARLVVDIAVFLLQRRHDVVGDAFHERRRNVQAARGEWDAGYRERTARPCFVSMNDTACSVIRFVRKSAFGIHLDDRARSSSNGSGGNL